MFIGLLESKTAIVERHYRRMFLGLLSDFSVLLIWNTLSTVLSVSLVPSYIDLGVCFICDLTFF